METGELIRQLRILAEIGIVNAVHDVGILNEAADRMEELDERVAIMSEEPVEAVIEGGGHSWWHVCEECHGEIDSSDIFCRHCGRRIKKKK